MFIDTHAHLTFPDFDKDRKEVIKRARSAKVEVIVNIGSGNGLEDNFKSLELAKANDNIFSTIGFHPHDATKIVAAKFTLPDFVKASFDATTLSRASSVATCPYEIIKKLTEESKVVAVGEIGLDYHYIAKETDFERRKNDQIECFKKLIAIADETKLPIIVHDREAHDDTLFTLKSTHANNWGGVMHCFSGSTILAGCVLDLGYYISVTGAVTFKKKAEILRDVVKYVPIERLLIETDCPFIAPEPYRGGRNEPAYVVETAKKIAEIKKLSLEDVARITALSARKLFHLPGEIPDAKIAYPIRDSLYLNITNRCTLACTFCPKRSSDYEVKGHNLKLLHEPDVEDVFKAIGNPMGFKEIVFCGFGEPTMRLELVKVIAKRLRKNNIFVRLDTDGLANLIHGRNVLPELKGLIDEISISLNAENAKTYAKICPSKFGEKAFNEVLNFIREAGKYVPKVTASVVSHPEVNIEAARALAEKDLKVKFRVREYREVG